MLFEHAEHIQKVEFAPKENILKFLSKRCYWYGSYYRKQKK